MSTALFLFHRDLRIQDNTALAQALLENAHVMPAFIFTPEQIDPARNKYFSHAAVQFMCESLEELRTATNNTLQFFRGDTVKILAAIHKSAPFTALYQNKDITHYAQERDSKIAAWCTANDIAFHNTEDYDLFPTDIGLVPASQKPYTILAQYYARYLKDLEVAKPLSTRMLQKLKAAPALHSLALHSLYTPDPHVLLHGGRKHALARLRMLSKHKAYANDRNFPANDTSTTKLSAYIKFGCISIREMYWACVNVFQTRDHPLIRELIFRSFYYRLYSSYPREQRGQAHLDSVDKSIPWDDSPVPFHAWKQGRTGFPLVDAGMRQLAHSHWMHNRVRMLVASTLTRYLLVDWRKGERYFATQLVDYDPISNVAGWQWGASIGYDNAQTIFRSPMNPFIQSKKFDPEAKYIKQWVPELAQVPPRDIHKWGDPKVRAKYPNILYPAPIVDQKEASARATTLYRAAAKSKN